MTVYNGRLLIADTIGDELYELDPDGADTQGTRLRALPTGLTSPHGMTVYNGRLLIADTIGDELYELDPDGADTQGTRLRALPTGLTNPYGMTVYNGRLLIADTDGDELYELDPDGADTQGTRLRALPTGLTIPHGMTVLISPTAVPDAPIQWHDGAPNVTATARFLWRSARRTQGIPAYNTAVSGLWSEPKVEGVFGEEGPQGEQGEAGASVELAQDTWGGSRPHHFVRVGW